jgi:phosphatidylinositol glycan class S
VINADVARCVEEAVQCVRGALQELGRARLQEALRLSTKAFHMAETAFSNPSLLALLYFPDDQK